MGWLMAAAVCSVEITDGHYAVYTADTCKPSELPAGTTVVYEWVGFAVEYKIPPYLRLSGEKGG